VVLKMSENRGSGGRHPEGYLFGYDIGTSGTKTAMIDLDGNLVYSAFDAYKSYSPKPTWHEQNPGDWWRVITETTREALKTSKVSPNEVLGICFAVQGLGMVPVDRNVNPLRPLMTWLDARSESQAKRINEKTGLNLSAKDPPAKVLWLKENEPDMFQETYKILDVSGYLIAKSIGSFTCSPGSGQWYGYSEEKGWTLSEELGVPIEKLPKPATKPQEIVGGLTDKAAKGMGLRKDTPVMAGGSDFLGAVVGSGAILPGHAHMYLGTSAWIGVMLDKPIFDSEGRPHVFRELDGWIAGAEAESACACLDWFKDELAKDVVEEAKRLNVSPYDLLNQMAEKVEPGSGKLIFTPWMKGERAPVMDDCARGAFIGLTTNHRREHLLRAVLEGNAYNMAWIMEQIEGHNLGFKIESLRTIGGGTRSKIWMQIFADVMGKNIQVVKWPLYSGAIGIALVVAVGLGVYRRFRDLDSRLPIIFEAKPREEQCKLYQPLYTNFKESYAGLVGIFRGWGPV